MPNFPFVGSQLEVICSITGVRYRGRLLKVESGQRVITLVNVHHFGSEDRPTVGGVPIPAKGALPKCEQREIHSCYIDRLRVLDRDEAQSGPDRTIHRSSTAGNTRRETNGADGRTRRDHREKAAKRKRPVCLVEELIEISDDEEIADGKAEMGTGVPDRAHDAQPEPAAPSTTAATSQEGSPTHVEGFSIDRILEQFCSGPQRGVNRSEEVAAPPGTTTSPAAELHSHATEPEDPPPPADNGQGEPRPPKRVRFAEETEYIEYSNDDYESSFPPLEAAYEGSHDTPATAYAFTVDSPLHPVYFITQVIDPRAVGLLVNGDQHPSAPAYIGIDCSTLQHSQTRPVVGELWRPRRTTALLTTRTSRRRRRRSLVPLMKDFDKLDFETQVSLGEVEQVRGVEIHRRMGKIAATTRDARFLQGHVEVEAAEGVVARVQLSRQQFDGLTSDYQDLWRGDEVEVDMVLLEEECWVGPKYVLPAAVDYANREGGRAPFTREKLEERRIVHAKPGDCVPIRFRKVRRIK